MQRRRKPAFTQALGAYTLGSRAWPPYRRTVCVSVCERDRVKSVLLAFPSLRWLLVSSRPDEWVSDGELKVLAALCELWRNDTCGFDYLLPCIQTITGTVAD